MCPDMNSPRTGRFGETVFESRWNAPAWTLIAVNVIPLLGVLIGGWTLFEVVVLYWFENVLIGGINVIKMAVCSPDEDHFKGMFSKLTAGTGRAVSEDDFAAGTAVPRFNISAKHHAMKAFLIPFFTFHYGTFCFVHGTFVFVLLGGDGFLSGPSQFPSIASMIREVLNGALLITALALFASHLHAFVFHFLINGEYRKTNVMLQMVQPYARIVILHIAILMGAFAILLLGQPMVLLLLLVIGKTILDLWLHLKEHDTISPSQKEVP